MTLSFRRLLVVLSLFVLLAGACSSSEGAAAIDATDAGDTTAEANDTENAEASDADPADDAAAESTDATSIPVPAEDDAVEAAIAALDDAEEPEVADADPETIARDFVRSRFNIDPDPEWVTCLVEQSSGDDVLELALRTPSVGRGEVDDAELKTISFAMNGCIDPISLGDWATQAVGPQGEVAQTAPACFADRFNNTERGDITFYTFVALTYQFRVEPDGVPDVLDAFVNCTPVTALADFFANQSESGSNYTVVIDRDCLASELADPAVSELFWGTLIEGLQPPVSAMAPYLETCETDATAGLIDTLPDDFVPWSGLGTLASVVPASRANAYTSAPPMTIDESASYEAVLVTGDGEVRIQLFADTAPLAVNNFVNLARDGYFDGTVFHRVLDDFMAQGGDPTGTGTGGPGYQFADEFDSPQSFDRPGMLGSANTGPATNGSQFFITFVPTDWLTGAHTLFGEVTEGLDLVLAIERRDPAAPNGRGQVLESVTIIES